LRARYSSGARCTDRSADAQRCCGLLKEMRLAYAIARGNSTFGYIACDTNLVQGSRSNVRTPILG